MHHVSEATAGQAQLGRAYELLRERRFAQAEALCRQLLDQAPNDASVLHVLGLIRKDSGDVVGGEQLLARSIEIEPRRAEFRANLGNLLRRLGRLHEAELNYRNAVSLDPQLRLARLGLALTLSDLRQFGAAEMECRTLIGGDTSDPHAWSALAQVLQDQNRMSEAEAAYRQALSLNPASAAAHRNLGLVLTQMERSEEALAGLTRAESLGAKGSELAFSRGCALVQLYRFDEAEQAFAQAVTLDPRNAEAQLDLARLRFTRGDANFARDITAAAATARDNKSWQLLHSTLLMQAGDLVGAEAVLRDTITRAGSSPDARSALARVLHETGRLKEAEYEAMEAAIAKPQDASVVEVLVAILLSRGCPQDAEPFIRAQRARSPHDQGWIAYEATAARLLELPIYRRLYDYTRLVRTYDLEPPREWASLDELHAALLRSLGERHQVVQHSLDQSLRNGSRTVRSLASDPDPSIQALMTAFEAPIESYRRTLGIDPDHPLSARNHGAWRIRGAWSVQLGREGFHLNHFHRHGWISSAYYVGVPKEVQDLDSMPGWLKIGQPRFAVPGATPEVFIKPQAGRLVLFPSYMWHGTNPIHGPDLRTAVAFDVVPAPNP